MPPPIDTKEIVFNHVPEHYQTFSFSHKSEFWKVCDAISTSENIIRIFITYHHEGIEALADISEKYPVQLLAHSLNTTEKMGFACIHTIKCHSDNINYLEINDEKVGCVISLPLYKHLYLTGIEGEGNSFAEQAKYAYQEIDYLLSKSNFKSHDIFRFWNFIELIEKNYDIFNEIRKSYFQLHDIQNFPAATGIESSLINSKISLCAEGTDTAEAIQIKTLNSNLQNEASDYGPQFSRGKVLEFLDEGIKKIYISGTSNVGKNGESVFFENSDKNVKYVFECVEHLLKKESAELNDIVFSIVYSKTEEHFNVFQALYKKNNWNFPYIPLFTNICRENFFFEIECMAITTK